MVHGETPAHFSASVRDWWDMEYPGLWIGRVGHILSEDQAISRTDLRPDMVKVIVDRSKSSVERLKCYQCEVREAKLCTDEYLLPCPDNQAYDTCLTRIKKTSKDM
ncbi:hypothetical protein TNCV_1230661 [Trichonephila clavipes]|nr:hypothetical protein TNCV_1230661 [Trichonephila clavipes]